MFTTSFTPPLYSSVHDQLPPPFGEISNSLRASNLAWLPPTVHSNYSERLWLHARAFLVALGNRPGWPGELKFKQLRTCLTYASSTYASSFAYASAKTRIQRCPCNCRWNLAVLYGWKPYDIWQRSRHCGGRLIANSWSSCSQAYGFAIITMYSWWQSGEIGCAYEFEISPKGGGSTEL
jgi:hypothetical protein